MRILITGGYGLVGRRMALELSSRGHSVCLFDLATPQNRWQSRTRAGRLESRWGDIRDRASLEQAVAGQDLVVHNAGLLPPTTELNPELARAVNVGGMQNLVDCAQAQSRPPAIIFSSSISVHGPVSADARPATADDPPRPSDRYTEQKVACEQLLRDSTLQWSILRIGVVLDAMALQGTPGQLRMLFKLAPENRLEMIDVRDLALAVANLVDCPPAWNRILMLGGGSGCRVDYQQLMSATFGALGLWPFPRHFFGSDRYYTNWMDTEESQALLRFQRYDFDEYRRTVGSRLRLPGALLRPFAGLVHRGMGRWLRSS